MAQQKVVSTRSELTEVDEAHMHETEAVFYEYVFGRAREDTVLNSQETEIFEEARQGIQTTTVQETGASPAAIVGRRLAELGELVTSHKYPVSCVNY